MSILWMDIAYFLYVEVAALSLLMIPFIKPYMWQMLFQSKLVISINEYAYLYFNIGIGGLALLFFDAVREVNKYTAALEDINYSVPNAEAIVHMKLFRAQRNLYVSGFAVFLWLVLQRVCTLISAKAKLIESNEEYIKEIKKLTNEVEDLKKKQKQQDHEAGQGEESSKESKKDS